MIVLDPINASRALANRAPSSLSDEDLSNLLTAGEILDSYIKQARAEAERRLENKIEIPGWELIPGRGRTTVVDAASAFRAMAPLLTERKFLDCCTVGLGKLVDAVRVAEGVTEDDAKDIVGDYLKGNIHRSEGSPTLKRVLKCAEMIPLPQPQEAA